MSTHTGDGGVPGVPHTISENKRKFVIDFAGGPLATMEQRFDIKPVVSHSRFLFVLRLLCSRHR